MLESDLATGVVLDGRYELLTPVARGGMGRVWVARAKGGRGFRRLLAVKTMLASDYEESRMEEMLLQEAKIASMIHHPNVVAVEDFGEHRGVCYLAMELVRGETLHGLLKATRDTGGLPTKVAVNIIGQVCRGLQAAHDLTGEDGSPLGLVHRDVTPGNVIVTYGGVAKLLDFGIAKAANGAAMTQAGELKGKISYLAPEVLLQKPIDRRVDVFAVGVMLYMATTGFHPFREVAGSTDGVLARILSDRPPAPPAALTESYPPQLETVVMKALEKDRERRYPTAEALLRDLEEAFPEAFETGVEREIQEYLESLLSDRISETTAQIKAAELMAEQSSPDVSKVQTRPEEKRRGTSRAPMWAMGSMLAVTAAIAVMAPRHGEKEVVEKTVYLPGEVKTVVVHAVPEASTTAAPTAAPAPARRPTKKTTSEEKQPEPETKAEEETVMPKEEAQEERQEALPAVVTPAVVTPAVPTVATTARPSAGPKSLSSVEGHRRLTVNPTVSPYRPSIPKAIENMGPFSANVKMCVGPTGAPASASVTSSTPALIPAFRSAMMKWKYKPLTDGASQVSFCYSFQYEVR